MIELAATLSQVAMAAIVWVVILTPALLWLLRIRKPAFSYRSFRVLIGLLLIAGLVGFTGAHWNAPANDPMPMSVNFTNVQDARMFGIGLVVLGIAFTITSVLELSWTRLTFAARATTVGADLFLVGAFLGISVATSGWAASPFSKAYWTIALIGIVLGYLVRALRPEIRATRAHTTAATISA